MRPLDKTNFLNAMTCACYGWHTYNRKLKDDLDDQQLDTISVGRQVEYMAQTLFPDGYEVIGKNKQAAQTTADLINNSDITTIYQATALSDSNLLAKADIVTVDKDQKTIDIYEVKSTSNLNINMSVGKLLDFQLVKTFMSNKYLRDIAFQAIVFEDSGYKINKLSLIYINKQNTFNDKNYDVHEFLQIYEVNFEVDIMKPHIRENIDNIQTQNHNQKLVPDCDCRFKPKGARCPEKYFYQFNPEIPVNNSILNIRNIQVKKIKELITTEQIVKIADVTDDMMRRYQFNQKQINQIEAFNSQKTNIDLMQIQFFLSKMVKPLYFLDYETTNEAIPIFENTKPFTQIPFQFSLHVLSENNRLSHFEYLIEEPSLDNLLQLVLELSKRIKSQGSVVTWHHHAERNFQLNLVNIMPQFKRFFKNIEDRFVDLRDIFELQYYVHPGFEGKTSLKKITEVLIPKMSYSNLAVQEGRQASVIWKKALSEVPDQKQQIFKDLFKYCKYDTLTMVEIYRHLKNLGTKND